MKISIIGYSGSGKSTLAGKLNEKYKTDVLYLDEVHWLPGWTERSEEEKNDIIEDFLDSHDSWVIDGNYTKQWYERRMAESDQIVIMDFNRFRCLWRVIQRYRKYRGDTRPDMGKDCIEKLDWEFVKWVLWNGRKKRARVRLKDIESRYPEKTVRLRSPRQVRKFEQQNGLQKGP